MALPSSPGCKGRESSGFGAMYPGLVVPVNDPLALGEGLEVLSMLKGFAAREGEAVYVEYGRELAGDAKLMDRVCDTRSSCPPSL